MLQADLDELRQQVRDLTNRISRLEESLAPRESVTPDPGSRASSPCPRIPDILSQVPDTTSVLPVLGGGLLGLAGAYLLRAIAESGALPPRAVFTLGTLYAVAWLLWAARVPVERRFAHHLVQPHVRADPFTAALGVHAALSHHHHCGGQCDSHGLTP